MTRLKQATLTFRNFARPVAKDWYKWKVLLDEPPEILQGIEEVEYILHPTFPDRVRAVHDPSDNFALESEGWGEFDIVANVRYRDGQEQTVVVPLKLDAPWPKE